MCFKFCGNKKHSFDFVKNFCKNIEIEFLDNFYKNSEAIHSFLCFKCEHIWRTKFGHLYLNHSRCPKCAGLASFSLQEVKQFCKNKNIEFLDNFYKNNKKNHNLKCFKCSFIWIASIHSIKDQDSGCPNCSGNARLSLFSVKQFCLNKNIEFLDDYYKNNREKHLYKCLTCNHEWKTSFDAIKNGNQGCPNCVDNLKSQKSFHEQLKIHYPNVQPCIKKILTNKRFELDNYESNLKFAVEFDGRRWHNTDISKERDNRKNLDCLQNNIFLIRVDCDLYSRNKYSNYIFENIRSLIQQFQTDHIPKIIKLSYNNQTKSPELFEIFFNQNQSKELKFACCG